MRVISLHQFWASLMQVGAKLIETRHWATQYRGPLAIHAAQTVPSYARDEFRDNAAVQRVLGEHFGVRNAFDMDRKLPRSRIVCVVDLVDCITVPALPGMLEQFVPARFQTPDWQAFGNFKAGRVLWLCDNLRRLREPVKLKGRQNIWPLSPEVVDKIQKRI